MRPFARRAPAPRTGDLLDLLAGLGGTANDVAATLGAFGVRGQPADIHHCAIALYLNAVVGGDRYVRSVAVWNDRIRISFGRFLGRPTEVPLSACLRDFIDRFDSLAYPELVGAARNTPAASPQHG